MWSQFYRFWFIKKDIADWRILYLLSKFKLKKRVFSRSWQKIKTKNSWGWKAHWDCKEWGAQFTKKRQNNIKSIVKENKNKVTCKKPAINKVVHWYRIKFKDSSK